MTNKNPKFLKNILATSALTVAIASGSAFAAQISTLVDPANLSIAVDWVGGVAPQNGDSIQLTKANSINADLSLQLLGIALNGQTHGTTFIDPPAAGNAGNPVVLTLGYIQDATNANATHALEIAGAPNPALPQSGIILNGADDLVTGSQYSGLADVTLLPNSFITFNGAGPITTGAQFITAAPTSVINVYTKVISTGFDGKTPNSILGKGTGAAGGTVNIGAATTLTSMPLGAAVTINNAVTFLGAKAELALNSSSATAAATWTLNGGSIVGNAPGVGQLQLNATGNDILVNNTAGETLGTAANPLAEVEIAGNRNVTIGADTYAQSTVLNTQNTLTINAANFNSPILTTTSGAGQLVLGATTAGIGAIGADVAALNSLTFDANNTLAAPVAAGTIYVNAGKVATFQNVAISSNSLVFNPVAGDATAASFPAGFTLGFPITTTAASGGTVQFKGATTILDNIGAVANPIMKVQFFDAANNTQSLQANIYAQNISFLDTTVSIDKSNVTFEGNVQATGSTINLNSNQLEVTGVLDASDNVAINTAYNGTAIGTIALSGPAAQINDAGVTALTITLTDASTGVLSSSSQTVFPLVTGDLSTSDINPDTLAVNLPAPGFIIWSFDIGTLTFTAVDNATAAADNILTSLDANSATLDAASKIFNPNNTGDALSFAGTLREVAGVDTTAFKDAIDKFRSVEDNTSIVFKVIDQAQEVIAQRAETLASGSIRGIGTQNRATVAAGDDQRYSRYGAWGSPFYSHAVQKHKGNIDGYKANSGGATVGYDTMANDTMTIGLAGTYVKTDAKYKDKLAGDKSKINTYLFTIYGTQLMCDDYFVTGMASFGSSRVKNNSPRISFANGALTTEFARSSYDAMSWGGELIGGYHYKPREDTLIVPAVGLAYDEFSQSGYTERGTSNQNRSINQKNTRKLEALAGVRAIGGFDNGGILYTPEVHGYIRQALTNKSPKTEIMLNGMVDSIYAKLGKNSRTSCNLGTSLTVQSGVMDYSVSYEFNAAKKYMAHTGALKVRANF
jgi:outer membrane autotransporter protein